MISAAEQLRREGDELRTRIGDGPSDPTRDYRHLSEEHARERHRRDSALWRLDTARASLHALGPIGRRTHRVERRQLEQRIAGFETDVATHESSLADIEAKLIDLRPDMQARTRWEGEHRTDLDRLDAIGRQIDLDRRLDGIATRDRTQELTRDLGIDL
jgi:hypothetical protein